MEKDLVDDIQIGNKKKALVFGTNIGAEILKIPAIRIYTEISVGRGSAAMTCSLFYSDSLSIHLYVKVAAKMV